ncbi:hypothetical protein M8C21_007249 [Ambrosia artemisiifolia]|uniref:SURF1-like protein n=1 Tax=Ambrosia artemisiifolia TaxID=4212 RepID=A0AAD5C1R8_AMBAR|nr:hypothetical protein M8C21_007249 [Ambrosia artemisiifolia]
MGSISKSLLTARTIARASSLTWTPYQLPSSFLYSHSAAAVPELQPAPPPPPPKPTATSRSQEKQRGWTRFLLFVPGAITFGLGTWQIFRRQDKMPILVNRGWVPRSWRDKSLKALEEDGHPQSTELTDIQQERSSWWSFWSKKPTITDKEHIPQTKLDEVVGVIRGSEKPSIFVPANDPNSGQWFYVDVAEIANSCGLPENTIYIESVNDKVNPSNPYPIPKDNNALIRSSVFFISSGYIYGFQEITTEENDEITFKMIVVADHSFVAGPAFLFTCSIS